ncbi:MAG: sugar transferase [Micropepsaceae bacterium]
MSQFQTKRVVDIIGSSVGLLVLLPLMAIIGCSLAVFLGFPVLFTQRRPGLQRKPFHMYKFRTMSEARDTSGRLLPDENRLTRLGRILRATSLDELPELWNVLRGDMSLVGPRPLLMEYLEHYSPEQARRHEVRPGITGWAQVNGRNTLSWEDKFRLDIWYVDNQSLWLDVRILVRTVVRVLSGKDISAMGHATMPPFTGSKIQ